MLGKKNIPGFISMAIAILAPFTDVFYFNQYITTPLFFGLVAIVMAIIGIILVKNDIAGFIGIILGITAIHHAYFPQFIHPMEWNVVLAVFGYGIALANAYIGIASIRDLNGLKQQLGSVKAHKIQGRIESTLFICISTICISYPVRSLLVNDIGSFTEDPTVEFHTFLGGIIAFALFLVKVIPAYGNKDRIYKSGWILGPIGLAAWTLGYFTSLIDFFYYWVPEWSGPIVVPQVWPNIYWAIISSVALSIILYFNARAYNFKISKPTLSPKTHGVALILHGIAFGYENATKDLVGSPVFFKYVYPYTYKSLSKLSVFLDLDLNNLKNQTVTDALELYMNRCAEIGMAEKIKINWTSEDTFTVESVNCSTSVVRSRIPPEEIKGSICPWALLSASLINMLTGKNLEIMPSEFNEIGAKTELHLKETVPEE
ncbi:MAG TPA: hypothetical protein VKM55_13195 [Candidatus Lokiarchaeia archaeon]|nr:hypothetical protein [Candidatus Lokiarchaeia archaeon]